MNNAIKILEPAVAYELEGGQVIRFVKCENGTRVADGTTNEQVMDVLLHRLREQNRRLPSRYNSLAITAIEEAQNWLIRRQRERDKAAAEP